MNWHKIHFTGCGGVGMAGLAHIAADLGITVTGSDVVSSKMIQSLQKRGCPVVVGH
ncbi:MAG: Mur ligase domain-containing protein, partial [Lentisphaeria bacterium]